MRRPVLVFALLVLACSGLVAPVVAQDASTPDGPANGSEAAANATDEDQTEFTLEELKRDGPHQATSPAGVRMGDQRMFWAVYWPANNPFADVGSVEGGEFLPAGHTVGRNAIYLRTWTYADERRTVHVVYWTKGERVVTRGNTTTTVPIAENVTHVTHEVTFERGRPTVEIPLRQHDTPVRATMWIEGAPWARWTFRHHSIATTQAVNIDSAGDYLSRVIVDFLIWIVAGGFAVGVVVKKALDRAGIGPQYGYGPWIIGLTILTGLGSLLAYQSLADLVVNAKIVLAAYVVAIFGVILLETYTTNVSKALFLRPTLQHAESPTGEDGFDIIDAEARSAKIVRDGSVAVVTPGLLPFLARVFGGRARLENIEQLRTRVPLQHSAWDELFLVDPEADELLYYTPEHWTLSLPPLDRAHAPEYGLVITGLGVAALAFTAGAASGPVLAAVTLCGLAVWALSPIDGEARVAPAPVQLRRAFGTMVNFAEDVDDAKRFEEIKRQLDGERITKQRAVDQEVARHDRTLVEEMLDPDGQVPAAVERDDVDEDILEAQRSSGVDFGEDGAENGGGDDG